VLAIALEALALEYRRGLEGALRVDDTLQPSRTYDEKYVPPAGRALDLVVLPGGKRAIRPMIEGIAEGTFEDWVARTPSSPAPRDLPTSLRIEWSSTTARQVAAASARRSARITVSDVGFSTARDQALVEASGSSDSCASGSWLLLANKDGRWVVIQKRRTFIACGPSPAVTINER